MNYKLFEKELSYINNELLKTTVLEILSSIPNCMEVKPSSSTGKYHPDFDNEAGGNINHTKAVVKILTDLLEMFNSSDLSAFNTDNLYAAAILHDQMKYGSNPDETVYTVSNHPILAGNLIRPFFPEVAKLIDTHMGKWNTIRNEDYEVIGHMPTPNTADQWLLHLADYIASRKYISRLVLD